MHVISTQSLNFYGKTKFFSCNSDGKNKKITEYLYGSHYFGDTRGLKDFVQRNTYPYAYVEETIGKLHDDKTFKIYITDPNEVVDKLTKKSHDYIVYDTNPGFPDVKRTYFTPEYGNLDKEFQIVYDYFKRMENTATGIADTNTAKTNKKLADECKKIFEESAELRAEQENLKTKIKNKLEQIEYIKSNVEKYKKELSTKQRTLPGHKHTLEIKEQKLESWLDKSKNIKNKTSEELESIQSNIKKYTEAKEALSTKIKYQEGRISFCNNYILNAPIRIETYTKDIYNMKARLKEIEQAIRPNYEKLCRFYTLHGIKIIRRI